MQNHRSLFVVLLVACVGFSSPSSSPAADNARPLDGLRSGHPRLLFTAEDQRRIEKLAETEPLLARLIEQNRVNATAMLTQPTVRYLIPDGKRLLGQSRKCIERVAAMAMAYRLSGERKFADAVVRELLAAAKFKDWNPRHFLDTAEMTTAYAIGYDWVFDAIDPADRSTIREAMVRLGLQPGMKCYETGGWWTRGDNNWNQVCNGGMLLGALAIAEDEKELAEKIIDNALASIPRGVSVYAPDGAYPEGPGYWVYGTAYTAINIMGMRSALGDDFDLHKTAALDRTGVFRIHTIGPTGVYFNYADCGTTSRPVSTMFALSQTYDRPLYAWWNRKQLAKRFPPEATIRPSGQDRFFPLQIAWYDDRGAAPSLDELPRDVLLRGRQDIAVMRSGWRDPNAIYVGIKGGDNRTNHGHLDIGSFVLDAGGVRWAIDLGSDDYNMPGYFGGRRWQYYRMTNHSHNTLVIDGRLQNTAAVAKIVAFDTTPERVGAVVDMSEAYKGQAQSVLREIEMLGRRTVRVRDEIVAPVGEVRWGIVTRAAIKLDGNKALLEQDGKKLEAEIVEPAGAKFEIVSTKPPTARERQNEGTRMLATRVKPGDAQRLRIEILLRPAN